MITRRTALVSLMSLLAAPHAAEAQQAGKAARVGFLSPGDRVSREWQAEVVREVLSGLGWVEGDNLVIIPPVAGG